MSNSALLINKHNAWTVGRQIAGVVALSVAYALLVVILYLQAIHGSPVLRV